MRGSPIANPKRHAQCPQCGLYFDPRGLTGHLYFYHKLQIRPKEKKPDPLAVVDELKKQKLRLQLVEAATKGVDIPEEVLDTALHMFLTDYIFGAGVFHDNRA